MKKILIALLTICGVTAYAQTTTADVWINEFHYDGITTYGQSDQNEFVEIIIKNSIYTNATELAKYKLVLYNGGALDNGPLSAGTGLPYNTSSLLYTTAETEFPLSAATCNLLEGDFRILNIPIGEIQDVPAGFALVYNNTTVVQLLSYEKQFKVRPASAGGGPAADMTTTLIVKPSTIPAQETATTPTDWSVSLIGTGFQYNSFTWEDSAVLAATPCAINQGQTLTASAPLPVRWLDFKATGVKDKIYLEWKVAEETTTSSYEIQLKDVNGTYKTAGKVEKQLTNRGKYNFTIPQLKPGVYVVRIREIETTGRFSYSSEKRVSLNRNQKGILIYPNPVTSGRFALQIIPTENADYTISIIDGTGRIVKQHKLNNLQTQYSNTVNINVENLMPGMYQLKVKGRTEEFATNFVIIQ